MDSTGNQSAKARARKTAFVVCCATLLLVGCSRRLLSVFFDVPPDTGAKETAVQVVTTPALSFAVPVDTVRPPIEDTLDPDSVKVLLPRDHAGNIDWMAALNEGIIKPRNTLPGDTPNLDRDGFLFGFDFYFKNVTPMFDAFFPHSSHTKWVACNQCHPRIFRHRGTKITMGEIVQGKYCGECHGKVAFPLTTACERCHPGFPQPPNRAQPRLIGDIKLTRVTTAFSDSTKVPVDSTGAVLNSLTDAFPEATFPHWVHRIRYKCMVCHMNVFEPKAGANRILMKDVTEGEACGKCHNGKVAFDTGFSNCARCHKPEVGGTAGSP